jgi:ABC-type Mn2+/Zn2+ transport system ATPase subunit
LHGAKLILSDSVLELHNVSVTAGDKQILEKISLSLHAGEIAAIIGPNGAGKTTLLKACLGLLPLSEGTVSILGMPLSELGKHRDWLGYVPQGLEIDRTIPITVHELLNIYTPRARFSRDNLEKCLKEVDVLHLIDRQAGRLSGGELQRVLIALNLLRNPKLLFLDEPATGIDREGERLFYDILEQLRKERQMTVIMVSHDISVVYRYASRVFCINRELMCQGLPVDILKDETLERLYGHAAAIYEHHDKKESE